MGFGTSVQLVFEEHQGPELRSQMDSLISEGHKCSEDRYSELCFLHMAVAHLCTLHKTLIQFLLNMFQGITWSQKNVSLDNHHTPYV